MDDAIYNLFLAVSADTLRKPYMAVNSYTICGLAVVTKLSLLIEFYSYMLFNLFRNFFCYRGI